LKCFSEFYFFCNEIQISQHGRKTLNDGSLLFSTQALSSIISIPEIKVRCCPNCHLKAEVDDV
jgi:hypothetical protein